MRKYPTIEQYDFTITAEQDDTDKATAEQIHSELNSGNVWAWASVTVKCSWNGFEGIDSLGGCFYKSESDFKTHGGYYSEYQTIDAARKECSRLNQLPSYLHPIKSA